MTFKETCLAASKRLDAEIKPASFFLVIDDGKDTHLSHTLSEKRLLEVLRSFIESHDVKRN